MKGILFTIGNFSGINNCLCQSLFHLSGIESVEVIDMQKEVHAELLSTRNKWFLAKEYGIDFLLLEKSRYAWRTWALTTSYMYHVIAKKAAAIVQQASRQIDFTLQTQSMFNAAVKGIPHFTYTDSTVLANQAYPYLSPRSYLKSKAWMQLEPAIYHDAAVNFVFSSDQAASLQNQYNVPATKIACVLAGSNAPLDPHKIYGNADGTPLILFVGVNWERKGGPSLYRAFRQLREHIPVEMAVVGCTPDLPQTEGVTIYGRQPKEVVDDMYAKASVFCMPTLQEPFGIVFVEAMHRQLPIVATNIGAIPDLVENGVNGFRVPPQDDNALFEALRTILLDEDLRCIMGQAAVQKAGEYTWDKTAQRMVNVIRQYV